MPADRPFQFHAASRVLAIFSLMAGVFLAACNFPAGTNGGTASVSGAADPQRRMLADFEKPDSGVLVWKPLSVAAAGSGTQPIGTLPGPVIATQPDASAPAATEPAPATFSRSSVRPEAGLWSEKIAPVGQDGGILLMPLAGPSGMDLGGYDTVAVEVMHLGSAAHNGEWLASIVLTDTTGATVEGDAYAITSQWEELPVDLPWAAEQGLNLSHVASMGIALRSCGNARAPSTAKNGIDSDSLDVQTDTWTAEKRVRHYEGSRVVPPVVVPEGEFSTPRVQPKPFFVESRGGRLSVGVVDQYEITFWNRGSVVDGGGQSGQSSTSAAGGPPQRPWLEIRTGSTGKSVVGKPGTGLMLLDQENLDKIGSDLRRDSDDVVAPAPAAPANLFPAVTWPLKPDPNSPSGATISRWHWEVVWTSPLAALVEVRQEAGPYDRLGEPAATLTWRFMIYQWGEIFVHLEWAQSGEAATTLSEPITWALALDNDAMDRAPDPGTTQGADAQRLLSEIYPAAVRAELKTALPHRMQTGAPVAIIGKTPASASGGGGLAEDAFWWALGKNGNRPGAGVGTSVLKMVGVGLGTTGPASGRRHANCMLLVNSPNALMKAGAFSQYLVPPKVITTQGELDRNFPGDADNDGFVESYGFQTIRLANGRAAFTIYPQQRPIFYPAYLFTIPAIERDALDVQHSRILVNIDGKQFADPPQFPDGSFLLQFPYVLDRPVSVEAVLVKR